jgi:chromosome segregation ATPase
LASTNAGSRLETFPMSRIVNLRLTRYNSRIRDTLEKRVQDLEQILAHLPENLDARFAGVDVKLAELREVLALHTKLDTRLNDLDRKFNGLDGKVDGLDRKVDGLARDIRASEERILAAIRESRS